MDFNFRLWDRELLKGLWNMCWFWSATAIYTEFHLGLLSIQNRLLIEAFCINDTLSGASILQHLINVSFWHLKYHLKRFLCMGGMGSLNQRGTKINTGLIFILLPRGTTIDKHPLLWWARNASQIPLRVLKIPPLICL